MDMLDTLVRERLGGDKARMLELFNDRAVLDLLRRHAEPSDWYRFKPATLDGQYLVETPGGYQTYQQERGLKEDVREFASLRAAAGYLFGL